MLRNVNSKIEIRYYVDGNLIEDIVAKFGIGQRIYIVKKKRRKIYIVEDEVAGVHFTNIISYKAMNGGFFLDNSKNIFTTKEDAYKYAEKLDRRRNIKYKTLY